MRRREFVICFGGAAVAWPLRARAQQTALPVVGFVRDGSADASVRFAAAFRKGLDETGYVEGQNVTVEYHWLEGQYDRLPALMADLVRRKVAVIAAPGFVPARAAKAATGTIPIVFGVGDDPVRVGLVASLARPGGNATGVNILVQEVSAKRLRLLHELVPKAVRIAVLVNPRNAFAESVAQEAQTAAPTLGLQIEILNASTIGEIDAAFATFARERLDALFVAADAFFVSRRVQLATLTARDRIPAAYGARESVEAGGLMSYGTDLADMFRQVGVYTGNILKGAKPAEMPVLQSTKFEFVINLQTARALGIAVPPGLISFARRGDRINGTMSAFGTNRTWRFAPRMSAFDPAYARFSASTTGPVASNDSPGHRPNGHCQLGNSNRAEKNRSRCRTGRCRSQRGHRAKSRAL
jgi:putative ABC transport system substrate-binding protein